MEQSGEYRIAAGLDEVWRGLNDPEVLANCIDGCQTMEKRADNQFAAAVKARVGPVRATFQLEIALADIRAPTDGATSAGYTINADVKGGVAGFGKGSAQVTLADDAGATLLNYQVRANVGGKLAQVGSRLIDGVARKMADDFFAVFGEHISGQSPQPTGAGAAEQSRYETSGRWLIWAIMFGALITAMVLAI